MFKKAAQIAATLSLLTGLFLGYTRAFSIVADRLAATRDASGSTAFPELESSSSKRATELAAETFGKGHWAADRKLKLQYYDRSRGAWLYAQRYELLDDRRKIKVWPFAMISTSKDGESRKTATALEAVVDLSQPFDLVKKSNEPSRVTHAKLVGDVVIRDDKSTRDPLDDLIVRMNYVEFDDTTLQITSESEVALRDQDMLMTGIGLNIQLRRKVAPPPGSPAPSGGGGFDAETIAVFKNVHIVANDVNANGILPGSSKPDAKGRTPLDLTCDGLMRIRLPQKRPMVLIGPPDLRDPDPTLAWFERNVKVVRGLAARDQLNCDTLDLTLVPGGKADAPTAVVAAEADATAQAKGGGPLTNLKLRKALAQGHAVWIQSESQGLKARCTELKHEKHQDEGQPDRTYLNGGGNSRKLWVEKVDYTESGAIKSVMTLNSFDATIFDYGPGGTSRVIARGPGKSEERPARDASVARTAWWDDEMELRTWRDVFPPPAIPVPGAKPPLGPLRRLLTLTGPSKLVDHKEGNTLDARARIVAEFASAPKPTGASGDGPSQIKWLQAFDDVHLTANGKTLTARRQFDATFVQPDVVPMTTRPAPPAGEPIVAQVQAPGPLVVADSTEAPLPESRPDAPPPPPEPMVDGRANYVYATILQGGGGMKGEVKDAKLRGAVMVHQDPSPGEASGKDATGEALDLFSQGQGLMMFKVANEEPPQATAPDRPALAARDPKAPKTKLASRARPTAPTTLARVEVDGRVIEAPYIMLDQQANFAHARGAGHIVQMAERGLLDDKGLAPPSTAKKAGGPNTKDRLVITWNEEMKAFGTSKDLKDRPAAKFEFRGRSEAVRTPNGSSEFRRGVHAKMEDATVLCDTMDVYMDRTIAFNKPPGKKPNPSDPAANRGEVPPPAEPDAQIAMLDCRGETTAQGDDVTPGVDIISQKKYPDTGLIKELQRIKHVHVLYDKRTGEFEAPGAGIVYLYQDETRKALEADPARLKAAIKAKGADRPNPLKLTKVAFNDGMRGRFGVAKDQAEAEPRNAEFLGYVQTANAMVNGIGSDIDFDHPPPGNIFLTSDVLRVRTVPPPPGSKGAAPRQWLYASGNAQARTDDRTIQGDRITFDSGNDVAYVYGDQGKEIVMIEQKSPGQPYTASRGKAARYNKRTREFTIQDPHDLQMVDLKTGFRPVNPFPTDTGGTPKPMDPLKPNRVPLVRPARSSTERYGFNGH